MIRRLVLSLVLLGLSAAAAHAQGNQCRTSPVGASTAYCASEAFVTQSIGNGVQGPVSAVDGDVAVFDGTSGKLIKDAGGAPFLVKPTSTQSGNITASSANCFQELIASGGGNATLALPAASSVSSGCEIGWKNGEVYSGIGTASGKKIGANFPSDWNDTLWPGQAGKVISDGTNWQTSVAPGRWRLPTSAEICVAQNGNDANDGLAAGTGCKQTPQAAALAIGQQWDGGGYFSCSIGFYAGGTNTLAGANQTGQSIGCFLTINIRGAITWASTGSCWDSGDNGITIVNWNLGFTPTFACNSANTVSTGQFKCHQTCIYDFNGGTAIWLPGGSNDVFFDVDLQGSATYNATVDVGDGVNTYTPLAFVQCEAHCSKVTMSGSLAFSAHVTMGVLYVLRAGSVITTTLSFAGVTVTNPTTPTGNAVLITNGTTIPGGTTPSSGFPAQNSSFGLVCSTVC